MMKTKILAGLGCLVLALLATAPAQAAAEGSLKWSFAAKGHGLTSPVIGADGTIYIVSYYGKVYALHSRCGGLAATSWPKFCRDARNTGCAFGKIQGKP